MSDNIEQSGSANDSSSEANDPGCCRDTEPCRCNSTGEQPTATQRGRSRNWDTKTPRKTKRRRTKPGEPKPIRGMSLATLAKEYIWLWDVRHGVCVNAIAMRDRVTVRRVQFGVSRARAQEKSCPADTSDRAPRLIPFFPIGPYTPQSACGHKGPIEAGSLFCCVVCHQSGIDDHPALQRDPLTDPVPEPKPGPAPKSSSRETRKQRRLRKFGTSSFIADAG